MIKEYTLKKGDWWVIPIKQADASYEAKFTSNAAEKVLMTRAQAMAIRAMLALGHNFPASELQLVKISDDIEDIQTAVIAN